MGDLKEFVHGIMGAGRCEICSSDWQAGNSGRISMLQC